MALGALPLLVLVGIIAIVATSPAFFASGPHAASLPILDPPFKALEALGTWFVGLYSSDLFVNLLPKAAGMSMLMLATVPAASLVAAARAKTWEPTATVLATLAISVFSLPLLGWLIVLTKWIWGIAQSVVAWWSGLTSWTEERFAGVGSVAVKVVLVLTAIAWLYFAFRSAEVRRWSLWAGLVALVLWLLLGWFHVQDTDAFLSIADWVSSAWSFVTTALGWLLIWVLKIVLAVLGSLILVGVLGQIGSTFWTPFTSAWTAGGRRAHTADFVAGSGVAASILLTAAAVNPAFREWLYLALEGVPGTGLVTDVVGVFSSVFPEALLPAASEFLRGVSGFPEFAVITLSCFIGSLSLLLSSGDREDDGLGGIATLAIARTLIAVALALPVLVFLWWSSGD